MAAASTPPAAPLYSIADITRSTLRTILNGAIGAAVGAVAGFLLDMVLWGIWSTGDVRLLTGGGLVLGVFFNQYIVRALRLTPKREREAQAAGQAAKAPADGPPPDSFREVVETVVFVVVLVLMLKSFDAEAFVIPTGSMAETLLGYQKMVTCPQCGYTFPANCSQQVDPTDPPSVWVGGCVCPNCREHIRFVPHDDDYVFGIIPIGRTYFEPGDGPGEFYPDVKKPRMVLQGGKQVNVGPIFPNEVVDPAWGSGDRVLVAKFLYDLFESSPDRLDVVVFKYPGDEHFPRTGPFRDGVPMNYIKRLIGLPGETIAIHNGDLYVLEAPSAKRIAEAMAEYKNPDDWHKALLDRDGHIAYFDLERVPEADREEYAKQLWEKEHMHVQVATYSEAKKAYVAQTPEHDALDLFDDGKFQIIRKSPENILKMRRIVYDNDHPAKDLLGVQPPRWADRGANGGWQATTETSLGATHYNFKLNAPSDDAVHWLGYRHLLRDDKMEDDVHRQKLKVQLDKFRASLKEKLKREPPEDEVREENLPEDMRKEMMAAAKEEVARQYAQKDPQLITDFMGYNTWEGPHGSQVLGENWVGDLILECDVQTDAAQGELTLELSRGVDRFRARFDLASGVCTLVRAHQDGKGETEETLDSKPTGLKGGGNHSVRFANVDQRLTVWVDDSLPFGDGVLYTPAEQQGPTPQNDLAPAGIGLKGAGGTIRGLRLWRDTYYTTAYSSTSGPTWSNPSAPDAGGAVNFSEPSTWGALAKLPIKTIYVQPHHFLCLGDNSPQSSDGRSWGLVPERLLLGKAIAVYYPFDRFGRIH
jgi:signal peptidase I